MIALRSESAAFGDPDGPRASERHDPGLLQVGKAAQIVGRRFQVQMQRGARQADRAQCLATQLRQPGADMLDAGARRSDAAIASLLRLGQSFLLGPLYALHEPQSVQLGISLVKSG